MAEDSLASISKTLGSIEANLKMILSKLDSNDARFQRIEDRINALERNESNLRGIGFPLMLVVPAIVTALIRFLFP